MKKMLILITVLAVGLPGMSQPPTGGTGKRVQREGMQLIASRLNLSDTQKINMKALQQQYRQEQKAITDNEQQTVEAQRNALYKLRLTHQKNIKNLLTQAQQQQLHNLQKQRQEKMQGITRNRFGALADTLRLNTQQKKELETLQSRYRQQLQELQQHPAAERITQKNNLKQLQTAHEQAIQQILTASQYEQWKQFRGLRAPMHHLQRGSGRHGRVSNLQRA